MAGTQEHSDSSSHDYDIFLSLSHRDSDFINHLDTALVDAGFRVFKDGDPIPGSTDLKSEVKRKIDRSKISVIVLTKNYVSSKWYLDQLLMIIEAKKNMILPVYDGIHPGRAVEALERFEDQLKVQTDSQMRKNLMDKIKNWSGALSFAADLGGLVLQNLDLRDESMLIREIIGAVEVKVKALKEDFAQTEAESDSELLNQVVPLSLVEDWSGVEINLMNIEELPENPNCPFLVKLLFQNSNDLSEIPYSFFESMPLLQVLDLSNTSIKTLPPSIASLVELREFFLRDCMLLSELPAEIGELGNLEVFDLERTELIYLPKEIGRLHKLECLKFSLHKYAVKYSQRKGIETIIPRETLIKFSCLKELSILVDPDCDWWDSEIEAVIIDLPQLQNLQILNLFFPTPELLHKFLRLGRNIYKKLSNFTLTVGRHEQRIISNLPDYFHSFYEKLDKCLIYVNGKGNTDGIVEALEHARTLFLDRQWTMEKLSNITTDGMCRLNSCLVIECNEMSTIVDTNDFYQDDNISGRTIFGSLHNLSLYYMKNLQSIWRGPIVSPCFSSLEILTFHTCPKLTTIFNLTLLPNLKNLKELMVENCPIVKILITVDTSQVETDSYFLPALKKILLTDLPELVSISGGIRIGPKLESIISSNCPMLKNISPRNEGATGESLLDIHLDVKDSLHKSTEEMSRHIPNMKPVISDDFSGVSSQYSSSSSKPLFRRIFVDNMGARIVQSKSSGQALKIRETTTQPFAKWYEKHHPLNLEDEVWRLKNIEKDGLSHMKLHFHGIHTVQDLLKLSVVDYSQLKTILGLMSEETFKQMLDHARTCVIGSKLYSFRGHNYHIVLDPICRVVKVIINGKTYNIQDVYLTTVKDHIDKLVKEAYSNWSSLEEINGLLDPRVDPYDPGSIITTSHEHTSVSLEVGKKFVDPEYGGSTTTTSQEHSAVSTEVRSKYNQ